MKQHLEKRVALLVSFVMFASILLFVEPLSEPADAGMTWLLEVVDSQVGDPTSIEIDSLGNPWIFYAGYRFGTGGLIIAQWTGSSWTYHSITQGGGYCISLALDSSDHPHAVYDASLPATRDMHYAYWDGVSWTFETIESQGNLGSTCSIAIDSLDRPHVSYEDYSWLTSQRRDLKYAWKDASGWHIETVDWQGYVGRVNSITLDSLDRPHISYTDVDNDTLKYAWLDGLSWNISIVDDADMISSYNPTSLRLDSLDRPHIAYMRRPLGDDELRYASWDGLSWTFEQVTSIRTINWGDSLSLRLDSSDIPSIAYTNHSGYLSYASKQGGSWVVENVDKGGGSILGLGASLALDSGGNPHISYTDDALDILKYARRGDDSIPPSSSVDQIVPYWASSPRTITATATDGQSRVSNVTLYYQFSPDNRTWGLCSPYVTNTAEPWSWTFPFPEGGGFYRFHSIAVDIADNQEGSKSCQEAMVAYRPPLVPGHRLISFPLAVSDDSVESVLSSVSGCYDYVRWYDPLDASDPWKSYVPGRAYNDLKRLDNTMGFWINVTATCGLVPDGTVPTSTMISLHRGWNMVGFPSFNISYTVADLKTALGLVGVRVEAFDSNAAPYFLQRVDDNHVMKAGEGYWVYVPSDATWIVNG